MLPPPPKPSSPQRLLVVVGEALVDDYGDHQVVGGAPFNVARTLAAFGVPVRVLTRIAEDPAGALVRADFARFGLDTTGLQTDPHHPTGRVVVERLGADHRFHILDHQAWDHLDTQTALAALADVEVAALYCGTLMQRSAPSRAAIQGLLQAVDAPHYVDLNLRSGACPVPVIEATLHRATTLKVNEEELRDLLGWFGQEAEATCAWDSAGLRAGIDLLFRRFGLERMIITRGAEGAACVNAAGAWQHAPAGPPPPRWGDTVGAGDAFSAVVLLGDWWGWPLGLTLERANAFAAAICGLDGAVPTDADRFYGPWRLAWGLGAGAGSAPRA